MSYQDDPGVGLNAAVAAEVRGEIAARGWTLKDLEAASGVNYFTVRRLLAAERHMTLAVLEALAKALDTTAGEIVGDAQTRLARALETKKAARKVSRKPSAQ